MGDAAFQEKAKARLRSLFDRSQAVVLVSHDLRRCGSCARAGSGFSKGGWWTTVRSIM